MGVAAGDLAAVVEIAAELRSVANLDQRRKMALQRGCGLLGAEVGAYNLVDRATPTAAMIVSPQNVPDASSALRSVLFDHPLIEHYMTTHDTNPRRLSDVSVGQSVRDLRRTRVYTELLRLVGMRQLAVPVDLIAPVGGDACTFHRSGSDFATRDVGRSIALQIALVATLGGRALAEELSNRPDGNPRWVPARPAEGRVLTQRQWEVLFLLGRGVTVRQVAEHFLMSPHTVTTHRRNAYTRLGVTNSRQAAQWVSEVTARSRTPIEDRVAMVLSR
ncbi:LuxR C-terminal-related transcriptional regulator [Frankia sp. Mgl5]|uniref:helix-turn-helix transcriptional regulator n=1 Tax=Frankia sp. Mgl5 TaxID=2933793 RepID=UPI00200E52DF|nr:LuxR C-terminal-related transcriptional regulator [Frankia sp. Mgl5]MCK9931686.1 LuxR C-terminal-related transcriptional regulator [Frankia sp. Mgl5]